MAKPQRQGGNPGILFDPLQYMKRLEAVGFTREQAEAQAETFLIIAQKQLVTKQDLKEVEAQSKQDLKEVEAQLKQTLKEVEAQLTNQIKTVEAQLTSQIKTVEAQLTSQIKEIDFKIKELESKTMVEIELLRRDLKIWFGGMLVGLVVVMSGIMTLIVHLGGH